MFTNPFNKKYQTGGSAPTDDQKKEMQGFVTWIKSNIEGFKDKSEQEIAKSLSDMAKSDEGKKSVQDLYSRYQKSKKQKSKFADGGKFQDFICKHGRGGNVDCGCGGMVIRGAEGIDDVPTPKDSTVTNNGYVIYKPSVREVAPNGESVVITYGHDPNGQWARRMEWANGGTSILGGYNNNGQWVSEGDVTYGPTSEFAKAFLSPKARMSRYEDRPQSRQEGGELTRKQARILSKHNKGFDRGQFQLAMANADAALRQANPGIHGKELRQAKRRMVAGLNESPLATSATIESPILVAPSTGLVRSEVVETPKANVAQRSASTNRRSDIAKPGDFPIQEIVIPQISTNIPFGNGSRTASSNNSTTVATSEQEPAPIFINGRFVNASLPEDAPVYSAPRDSEGNIIIKDEGNGVYWTRDAEGRLQKHEPVRTATIATSSPRRNYSAITGQPLRNEQSTWDLFKRGGQIEKHQNANGIINHYRSKWANDWNNIKRGWNNFKDSAFGLVVPTSGTDVALMAAGPMFKIVNTGSKAGKIIESVGDVGKKVVTKSGKSITIIPEGVHGSEKAAKRALTESAPFISQKGELANEAARNINGLRKWLYGGYYNLTTNLPK